MSQDWKRELDERLARQEAERKRQEEARNAREKEAKEREYERRLAELARRFKCHICGTPASTPLHDHYDDGQSDGGHHWVWTTDWSTPGDLKRCTNCNKWTCDEHYHGICQKCASKIR